MNATTLASLLVWMQAFQLWIAGDSPVVPLAATALVALRLLSPTPLIRSRGRRVGTALLVALVLLFPIAAQLWPRYIAGDRDTGPPTVPLLVANCLLMSQVLIVLRQSRQHTLPSYHASLAMLTLVCGYDGPIDVSQRTIFLTLAVVGAVGCGGLCRATVRAERTVDASTASSYRLLLAAMFVSTGLGAWAVSSIWQTSVTRLQLLTPGWLAWSEGSDRLARGYVRSGTLRSITAEKQTDPMHVALRVYSDAAPGYLRGRVFDSYARSQWRLAARRRGKWNRLEDKYVSTPLRQTPRGIAAPPSGQQLFALSPAAAGPYVRMEIHNDPHRDEMVFAPLTVSYLQGEGSYLASDDHRVIYSGIDTRAPYTIYAARKPRKEQLAEPLRNRLVTPLPGIDPAVTQLAEEVCRGSRSSQEQIDSVVSFFQNNFKYTDETLRLPQDVDPLSHFLLNRIPAHCEFFASGAVALLRIQGIPCRYVTGYVVAELEGEYGDYWLARNRNAHAWAEAYDQSRQQWVLVEATPGMRVPRDDDPLAQLAGRLADNDAGRSGELVAQRRWFAPRWLGRWWQASVRRLRYALALSGAGIALVLIVAVVWFRSRIPRDANIGRQAEMQRLRTQLDRRLRRRNLVRQPAETLHQFARRVRAASSGDDGLCQCADWYLHYARARYNGESFERLPSIAVTRSIRRR